MKKLILLAAFCGSAMAQVAPVDVAQECISQMSMGICKVPVDRAMLAPGQTMILSGVGRVQMSALADYTDLYNAKVPTDPAMCDLALHYMTEQPGGDHDKIARAYWTPIPKAEPKQSPIALAEIALALVMGVGAATRVSRMFRSIVRKKVA
jgi:hypothetical protein